MNQQITSINNPNKAVNPQQFDKVVEAILAGKYSWACVLMLRIAGYNPLHYIPYRTYNRLLKENSESGRVQQSHPSNATMGKSSETHTSSSCLSKIKDLAYFEVVGKQKTEIRGGSIDAWFAQKIYETQSIQFDSESLNAGELNLINN
ncbi:heterocyst differentiation protein [Nostoc sp. CENA543]|uniref:HetP family heterocyst commitment protein n=1 Tax=Nostoc sp. CENA543 TaxID=1869241 RepID=UPI000CA19E0D|nr:HetP family heterocyst commitment protein [Nostoc sp. CENA543]AUT02642.1 heterocyst differentiation protein [Nostoc sp. CENA543]